MKLQNATLSILLSLSATVSLAATATPGKIGTLKVLTLNFNDEIATIDSDYTIRDRRFTAIKKWISDNSPDIAMFQEGWDYRGAPSFSIPAAKAVNYDNTYWVGVGIPGIFLDSNAIMAKKQLQMSSIEDLRLPHSSFSLGDGKHWVLPFGTVSYAIGVKMVLPNGEPIYVYTTHLLGDTDDDRADQIKTIDADAHVRTQKDGIAWEDAHVIIAGDCNSHPDEPGPQYMMSHGYIETFDAVHPGDTHCSDCADPSQPFFNPFTIAYGQFPSQTDEVLDERLDYIFVHSPTLKPVASTMVFTAPYGRVWMSDHYGILTTLSDTTDNTAMPNPVHDVSTPIADSVIIPISSEEFDCKSSDPIDPGCDLALGTQTVEGPRGATFRNTSDFYITLTVNGPGHIFTAPIATLNPGDATTFMFDTPGDFTYSVQNLFQPNQRYGGTISGAFSVSNAGF
jgi:endonuclease/exonuclease/phosphatase family metal-dependent hydrolase